MASIKKQIKKHNRQKIEEQKCKCRDPGKESS